MHDHDDDLYGDDPIDVMDRDTTSEAIGGFVVNWRDLDNAEAADAWEQLREWVEWFTYRYEIPHTVIPDCWWKHGPLVEELSALHTAHVAAFDPGDSGFGPISWHERLTLARDRFKAAYKNGCLNGHTDPRPRSWNEVIDEQEWAAWCKSTHAHPQEGNAQ